MVRNAFRAMAWLLALNALSIVTARGQHDTSDSTAPTYGYGHTHGYGGYGVYPSTYPPTYSPPGRHMLTVPTDLDPASPPAYHTNPATTGYGYGYGYGYNYGYVDGDADNGDDNSANDEGYNSGTYDGYDTYEDDNTTTTAPSQPATPTLSTPSRQLKGLHRTQTSTHPRGQCYCPYDHEWKGWAISDPHCRTSLYTKCQTDSRLDCDWLDAYFSASSLEKDFQRPHEQDIFNFLYTDCPPAAPCSCSGMAFNGKDQPAALYRCCSDLQVHAHVPHSGPGIRTVEAFCSHNNMHRGGELKAWVQQTLQHTNCPSESASAYKQQSQTVLASKKRVLKASGIVLAAQPGQMIEGGATAFGGRLAAASGNKIPGSHGTVVSAATVCVIGIVLGVIAVIAAAAIVVAGRKGGRQEYLPIHL